MKTFIAWCLLAVAAQAQSFIVSGGSSFVVSSRSNSVDVDSLPVTKPKPIKIVLPEGISKTPEDMKTALLQTVKMSHSEMVALHNELHGGGQWTWPGDLEAHLHSSKHGVSTTKQVRVTDTQPVVYQQNCPNGVCPLQKNPTASKQPVQVRSNTTYRYQSCPNGRCPTVRSYGSHRFRLFQW